MLTGSARLLTALLVIGLSAFAVMRGSQIIAFIGTKWVVEAEPSEAISRLGRWFSVPGVSFAARNAAIRNQYDLKLLREQFTELAVQSPFSASTWGALAGLGLAPGEVQERAVQALTMSAIIAPNELYLMPIRGKIGIALWEALPPERRISVATDLVTAASDGMFDGNSAELTAIFKGKSEAVRKEIWQHLLRVDGPSARMIPYLGPPNPSSASQSR